ncbi:hypothetical protein DFH06DRAFT_698239 [Mycena polygramma]|nr:hypothetical protein DFH06DRAFT_698239 [Mycena polygramma]
MRFPFPSRAKIKLRPVLSHRPETLPDVLWTALTALQESADAFPPLKSAVGGVIAICNIAERAKRSRSEARYIALRTADILDVIASAVPDGSDIPPAMLKSMERFALLLDTVEREVKAITETGRRPAFLYLNRNESAIESIKTRLDDAYRDVATASTMRIEVGLRELSSETAASTSWIQSQQVKTSTAVQNLSAETKSIKTQLSHNLLYSRLSVFLATP